MDKGKTKRMTETKKRRHSSSLELEVIRSSLIRSLGHQLALHPSYTYGAALTLPVRGNGMHTLSLNCSSCAFVLWFPDILHPDSFSVDDAFSLVVIVHVLRSSRHKHYTVYLANTVPLGSLALKWEF